MRSLVITILSIISLGIFPLFASADSTSIPIHLTIKTYDSTLFDGDVSVDACFDSELGTTTSVNAFCAITQVASSSNLTLGTTWYSFGLSLDSINSYTPDFANNRYWIYYSDRLPGLTSLNSHLLIPNEELLLTYGINPLRVISATTTPEVGTTTPLRGEYFDPILFDWVIATGTTFTINGEATTSDEVGTFQFLPSTTTPYSITVSRTDSIMSIPNVLYPFELLVATETPAVVVVQPSVGSYVPESPHIIDIKKAVEYLRSVAQPDGSYDASLYTDWVAIGLSSVGGADDLRSKLILFMKTQTDSGTSLTDIERHAMALEALGIDPSSGTSRDYIKEMLTHFDGTQWGDKNEINDDIFALFPLLHAGYGVNDEIVIKTVNSIISAQLVSGSWGSTDLTAAGIQALSPFSAISGVNDAIEKAKNNLHQAQGDDGGFGSTFATSWVLQAIASMSEEDVVINWTKNGRTPQDYLWLAQQPDGAVEPTSIGVNSRVWATAYAIPAANNKSWNDLLSSFPRSRDISSSGSTVGEVLGVSTSTATSSLGVATTTATTTTIFASTTPALSIATSSIVNMGISTTTQIATTTSFNTKQKITPSRTTSKSVVQKISVPVSATSSVITTSEPQHVTTSWTDIVVAPFARLFSAISSWFD